MKRVYTRAEASPVEGGWQIMLDGRPVKTPGRQGLVVPNGGLGQAIAGEWQAQGDEVNPRASRSIVS